MSLPYLRKLWAHMEWADAFLWRYVLAEPEAGDDDFVVDSLLHLHTVQRAYLSVWRGDAEIATPGRDEFDGLVAIRDWARAYHAAAAEFVAGLDDERLGETIPIPWTEFIERAIGGPPAAADLGDMLFQVVAHSVHHRAQINRRLRELGGVPSLIDYIGWVWRGQPAADWSDASP